jgi:hypothetical protein
MKRRRYGFAFLIAMVLLWPHYDVEACGPDFEPDVFVRTARPDDLASFAKGKLGILQGGFDSNEYAVAFRYLNGGKLSDAERAAYAPPVGPPQILNDWRHLTPEQIGAAQEAEKQKRQNEQPAGQWLLERAKYVPASSPAVKEPSFPTDYFGSIVFDENYLNCPDAAFKNAVLTLTKRADAWGRKNPSLLDWIHAQDAVFSNCAGKTITMPATAAAGSPELLEADRAYQTASARFYAKQFDEAARQFAAIAGDKASPWADWGIYLAARATVRKAFAMGKASDPYSGDVASYDLDTMKAAQQMLETLLTQPNHTLPRAVIQDELNFIRIRTEPEKRIAEICAALAGPGADANFSLDLADLNWALVKHIPIKGRPPLLAWIGAWRGEGSASEALAVWKESHALPWLVVAMMKAAPSDGTTAQLLAAAETIKPDTPAYETVFYHRLRLLIGLKRTDEARTMLDAALAVLRNQPPDSYRNALLGKRMAVARSFSEFLTYAPRTTLETLSQGAADLQGQCNVRSHARNQLADCPEVKQPLAFDEDAVQVLNQRTPVRLLIEAARTQTLPQNLRQDLAVMAWSRSVLLLDAKSTAEVSPLLHESLGLSADAGAGFAANMAILHNPGIRPYLEPGVSRVASYSYFDEFRNNWWCKPWGGREESQGSGMKQALLPVASVGARDEQAQADVEYRQLQELPDSAAVIGQRVIDYARQHSDDPRVPEALALTVRAGHYACQTWNANGDAKDKGASTAVSKAAFQLLHGRYPKSSWAAKTPYFY